MQMMTLGLAAAMVAAGPAFASTGDDIQDLRRELDELRADNAQTRAELAELKAEHGQDWLSEQRASEIRGVVQDVLADAETRTSLQDSGAMAGAVVSECRHDGGEGLHAWRGVFLRDRVLVRCRHQFHQPPPWGRRTPVTNSQDSRSRYQDESDIAGDAWVQLRHRLYGRTRFV